MRLYSLAGKLIVIEAVWRISIYSITAIRSSSKSKLKKDVNSNAKLITCPRPNITNV